MSDRILIIDFGSQYAQIIARRVRDLEVFCELLPWNAPRESLLTDSTKGVILSGGPNSVYAPDAPQIPEFILESGLPIELIASLDEAAELVVQKAEMG